MPSPRLLLLGLALIIGALLVSEAVAGVRSDYMLGIAFVVVVFVCCPPSSPSAPRASPRVAR